MPTCRRRSRAAPRSRWTSSASGSRGRSRASHCSTPRASASGPRSPAGILVGVSAFVTAGAGFLLAVLWFDLMFDVQVLGHAEGPLPEGALASIAAYYGRVTTSARPMNRLIATVMVGTLAAIVVEISKGDAARGVRRGSR